MYKAGMGKKPLILFLFFLLFLLVSRAAYSGDPKDTLRFGLPPFANPAALQQSFSPLAEYIAAATGHPVELSFSSNYIDHVMNLGQGKIDIAYVGPSPYVKTKDKFGGIELLAQFQLKHFSNNQVVIFTNKENKVNNINDLPGKTFAFGDYHSYGSHFQPRFILNEHGLPLKALAAYDYVGSHDNVILSVLHGDFAAGGVRFDIYNKYQDRGLRVIYGPIKIPPHVLVCRASLPDDLKNTLRKALLNLHDQSVLKKINPSMTGFTPVRDQDFVQAREVINFIESR